MHNCNVFEEQDRYVCLRRQLLDLRTGHVWTGQLSSSALSTALTFVALGSETPKSLCWLLDHVNSDGGWGDTPESISNLSTTLIVRDTLIYAERMQLCGADRERVTRTRHVADAWIRTKTGDDSPASIVAALARIYGHDRTFAVPILVFHAISTGDTTCWKAIPPLPFLLALLPRGFYRLLRLHVVSYALPALIAVGLCRSLAKARAERRFAWAAYLAAPLLRKLHALQPSHGGFLDATPLTAFVCLALRHAGFDNHAVYTRGCQFLRASLRPDGSTAIDSNLRTWVTSLAIRSLLIDRPQSEDLPQQEREALIRWYCDTQYRVVHPFTGAAPGGWAWTDLPGGVPDADDTSAALIALHLLASPQPSRAIVDVAQAGLSWLLAVQNSDGGIPTFCRGWGKLPFDQSCPDITAHAVHASARWLSVFSATPPLAPDFTHRLKKAIVKMLRYLHNTQHLDGRWDALWFGHQAHPHGKNPIVGTARVVDALRYARRYGLETGDLSTMIQRGCDWLATQQNGHGAWSMGSGSMEETALAMIALTGTSDTIAAHRGGAWLRCHTLEALSVPAPIGLYFALLWYHEQLYPRVWVLEALGKLENGTPHG